MFQTGRQITLKSRMNRLDPRHPGVDLEIVFGLGRNEDRRFAVGISETGRRLLDGTLHCGDI